MGQDQCHEVDEVKVVEFEDHGAGCQEHGDEDQEDGLPSFAFLSIFQSVSSVPIEHGDERLEDCADEPQGNKGETYDGNYIPDGEGLQFKSSIIECK